MYDRHFVRRAYSVRIGGWKIGRLRIGGGRYTVRPFTVADVFDIQAALMKLRVPDGMSPIEAAMADPFGILRPFVRFAVEERIKTRHLVRMTEPQFNEVYAAVKACNDGPYILKVLIPTEETADKKSDAVAFILAVVAALHGSRNEAEVMSMPFQKALAILDAQNPEKVGGLPEEKAAELSSEMAGLGFVVVN